MISKDQIAAKRDADRKAARIKNEEFQRKIWSRDPAMVAHRNNYLTIINKEAK